MRLSAGVVVWLFASSASVVSAQPDIFGPQRSAWGPRLDTIGISAATRLLWRGYDIGAGARGGAAVGIWGRSVTSAGAWHVSAVADGMLVDARHADPIPSSGDAADGPGGSRAEAGIEIGRVLGASGAEVVAWTGGYVVDDGPGDGTGGELGVRLAGIPLPWLPEVWPTLQVRASRTTGALEGSFLAGLIRQEIGIRQFAARLEVGVDTDDIARSRFTSPRWRAETGLSIGFGQWLARVDAGAVRNRGASLGWGGAGLTWRF
jgi:hypothetical protein